jgi:hypothetical protein
MAEVGDRISIVEGVSVLMVLHRAGSFLELAYDMRLQLGDEYAEAEFFTKVGTAYVHGIRNEEVMQAAERGEVERRKIYLM